MAVDEAILACSSGQPTLRLYAWDPFCLSLGYGQRAADVDLERLRERGWDIVRRPTGGRAILHGDELTYSVVLPVGHPLAAGDIVQSYWRISQALLAGLRLLGLTSEATEQEKSTQGGPVCFETPSHYEITAQGRKLVGSAQLRRKNGILQHGSLPLAGDIRRICDVLHYADEPAREAARNHVRARAITLHTALGERTVDWQTAADAVADGFRSTFDLVLTRGELGSAERSWAEGLVRDVYGNPDWTFRR